MRNRSYYKVYEFEISKVFHPGDELGLNLLRLMAAYNDLVFVKEWEELNSFPLDRTGQLKIDTGRSFFQKRLIAAIFLEILPILHDLKEVQDFKRIKKTFDPKTTQAFRSLEGVMHTGHPQLKEYMKKVRHEVTFHYGKEGIKKGLEGLLIPSGRNRTSYIINRHEDCGTLMGIFPYYALADEARYEFISNAFSQGVPSIDDLEVDSLLNDFSLFLDRVFRAYIVDRGVKEKIGIPKMERPKKAKK